MYSTILLGMQAIRACDISDGPRVHASPTPYAVDGVYFRLEKGCGAVAGACSAKLSFFFLGHRLAISDLLVLRPIA